MSGLFKKNTKNDYIICECNSNLGDISLNKETFTTIANITTLDFKEVVKYKNFPAIYCNIDNNEVSLNIHLKIKYNTNINNLLEKLQKNIYQNILDMTGIKVNNIDIKLVEFDI